LDGHGGQLQQRLALTMAVIERVNSKHGGALSCSVQLGGDPGAIFVVGNHEHLADYGKMRTSMAGDSELQMMMAGGAAMSTSVQDTISRVIVPSGEPKGWVSVNAARMHMPRIVDAMTMGVEIAEYVKNLTGVQIGFSVAMTGDLSRVMWSMFADDLAEIEALEDTTQSDTGYMELFARSEGVYVDGSLQAFIHQRFG
jgi:hypothetical protein